MAQADSGRSLETVTSPYNFVPFPKKPVVAVAVPPADTFDPERRTGALELTITALTDLLVAGTPMEEASGGLPGVKTFFGPGGYLRIPGSSLRGMLRTLVEIVSFSGPSRVEDRVLTYRAVADNRDSSLAEEYQRRLQQKKAGYLHYDGDEYWIQPAKSISGVSFWRVAVEGETLGPVFGENAPWSSLAFERREVYFQPAPAHQPSSARRPVSVPRVTRVQPAKRAVSQGWEQGMLIIPGRMQKPRSQPPQRTDAWIIAAEDVKARSIPVSQDIIRAYEASWSEELQKAHKEGFRLLPGKGEAIPCFYVEDAQRQQVEWLGHTGNFRIRYGRSVHRVKPLVQYGREDADRERYSLVDALFGMVEGTLAIRSRVAVEDAYLEGSKEKWLIPEPQLPQVLSSPKPTSFQLYLRQEQAEKTRRRADLRHWDSLDASLRGFKLYWHRSQADWREQRRQRKSEGDSQGGPIQPVKAGARFKGRIRFENLTDVELGALLAVLQLPSDCRHRLGMGKPLGMGSIEIQVDDLRLDDRRRRYQHVVTHTESGDWRWHEPLLDSAPPIQGFKEAFAQWMLQCRGCQDDHGAPMDLLWKLPELQTLKILLDWRQAPLLEKTAYPEAQEDGPSLLFRGRALLPEPHTIYESRDRGAMKDGEEHALVEERNRETDTAQQAAGSSTGPRRSRQERRAAPQKGGGPEGSPGVTSLHHVEGESAARKSSPARTPASEKARRRQEEFLRRLRGEGGGGSGR